MAGKIRIKPSADGQSDALCDTEIFCPVLHLVILCSAGAKSRNLSFFFSPLAEVMKRVRGVTAAGGAESIFVKNKP